MHLKKEDIEHIAKLARLDLTEEELEKYGQQLSGVLDYIDQLKEVDTENVEPTAQVTGLSNVFRDDEVKVWKDEERLAAINESHDTVDGFVKVKRVL